MVYTRSQDSLEFRDLLAVFRRRKRQIRIAFFCTFGLVLLVTLLSPKQYESQMKLLVKNERTNALVSADKDSLVSYPAEISAEDINSEIELLNSHQLLEEVVRKLHLDGENGGSSATGNRRALDKAVGRLQHSLTISAAHATNVIQVGYFSADPQLAPRVLQQLAECYLDLHLKVHGSPGAYAFFSLQKEHFRVELAETAAKLEVFNKEQGISYLPQQETLLLQNKVASEQDLQHTRASIMETAAEIAEAQRQLEITDTKVLTQSKSIPAADFAERLNSTLLELRNRRTALLMNYLPTDRKVVEVEEQIKETETAREQARNLGSVETTTETNPVYKDLVAGLSRRRVDLAGMQQRSRAAADQSRYYQQQLDAFNQISATEDALLRTQKEDEDNYLLYSKKAEESRIEESLDAQKIANVAIAEPPTEPISPSKPNLLLNLGLGSVLAGFVALGFAFAMEYFTTPQSLRADKRADTILVGKG